MTTKTLVRTGPLDFDRARESMRERAGSRVRIGDHDVRLTPEPLLRRGASGGLERPIRVECSVELSTAQVRDECGTLLVRDTEAITGGLRVFIPELEQAFRVTVSLPELSGEDEAVLELLPVRHWDIHLVHHSHLDIGYTDPQGRVLAEHVSYLDSALRLVKETESWDEDSQFRWSIESLWSFQQWASARPRAVVADFIEQVHKGRIELTAMPFNLHTETCSTDELHELLRLAQDTRREYGVPIHAAMQTDVPGCVGGLVDVLATNDVSYLSVAHNWAGRSVPHLTGAQDVPRLFWWQSPAGRRVLVWVTDTPHGLAYMEGPMLGFDASYEQVEDLLPPYLHALATKPYPFDGDMFGFVPADVPLHRRPYDLDVLHVRVQGHFGDNAPPRRIMSETVRRWNERWVYPHLRMSTNSDFFATAEARYGEQLQTFTGDWNNWWADGVGSGARPMQLVRRAQGLVADAQTVSTLAGVLGAPDADAETADSVPAYLDMSLFDEHTWGAAVPWGHSDDHHHSGDEQWHWKYNKAIAAHDAARSLLDRSRARLGDVLPPQSDAVASLYVVNPAAQQRSGVVRAFLPESLVPLERSITAVDSRTTRSVNLVESPQINVTHREAGRFLHVAVDDLPPLGLVRIDLVEAADPEPSRSVTLSGPPVLENEHLRVEVDLGTASISSIYAKGLDTELVRGDATFGFNAYVYDELGSAGGMLHQSGFLQADKNLSLLGNRTLARPAALVDLGRDAVRSWLTYETSARGASRIVTTLSLEHGCDRLDITNRIEKHPTMAKESAYFAFPFAATDAVMRHDATGSVTGPDLPYVPGGAKHMRVIRHWVALHSGQTSMSWTSQDVPLIQVGDIALPYVPFPVTTPSTEPATIYSWIHNNLWDVNFPSQQGFEMSFRYSVSASEASSPEEACVAASTAALAHSQPLVGVFGTAVPGSGRAEVSEFSVLQVSDKRVRVVGLTTPSPGTVLVRLQSVAETDLTVTLTSDVAITRADVATMLGAPLNETPATGGTVTLPIGALSTAGCLLRLGQSGQATT